MSAINYTWLSQYGRISTDSVQDPIYDVPLASLRDSEQAKRMLEVYNEHLRADCLRTTALYFMHSVRGLLLGIHYLTSLCDKLLDLSLENIRIQLIVKDERPVFYYQLINGEEREVADLDGKSQDGNSVSWREEMLATYYGTQLRSLIEGVALAGDANTGQMWAQLASILSWFKMMVLQMDITEAQREAVVNGYEYVINMPPEIIGLRKNLLTFKPVEIDNPKQPGEKMFMKPTCCMHYKVYGGQNYCYTCPRMSKSERQERYDAIVAAQ